MTKQLSTSIATETSTLSSIDEQKALLRTQAKAGRKAAVANARERSGDWFTANMVALAELLGVVPTTVIAGYWSMSDELDVMPALRRLRAERDIKCALPVVVQKDTPLIFRQWDETTELESGGFGTHHPVPGMPEVVPDIVLVPLLAFDEHGYRLGWGGGFYDRTLQTLRANNPNVVAVGTAYAGQQMDRIIRDDYDQAVDWIVSETEIKQATLL